MEETISTKGLLKEFESALDKQTSATESDDPFIANWVRKIAYRLGLIYQNKFYDDYFVFLNSYFGNELLTKHNKFVIDQLNSEEANSVAKDKDTSDVIQVFLARPSMSQSRFRNAIETLSSNFQDIYDAYYEGILRDLGKDYEVKSSNYLKHLKELSETFRLNQIEQDILTFFYIIEVIEPARDFLIGRLDLNDLKKSTRLICKILQIAPTELKSVLGSSSRLVRSGLIRKDRRQELELESSVTEFLSGLCEINLVSTYVRLVEVDEALKLTEHNIPKEAIDATMIIAQTRKGSNILLFGQPGTGKTEFAKSLGKELNKKVYFINQRDEDGDESLLFRKRAVVAALNTITPDDSILVIDECDRIINAAESFLGADEKLDDKKAWLNDLLETSQHTILWISNKIKSVDESTKRRFSYSVEFSDLGQKQRLNVWRKQTQNLGVDFLTPQDLEYFSKTFRVNAGGISLALKDIKSLNIVMSREEKVDLLKKTLLQHEKFVFGLKPKLASLSSTYELSVLNADTSLIDLVGTMKDFNEHIKTQSQPEVQNMNLLLQGPPGTGKTEFVKYLAEQLGLELIIKRLSDIRSPWYGESLRNIAAMFTEAQNRGGILFLDEADSFFMDRQTSHDHYKAETNELLTQMENFKGILVCATNFSGSMDSAVMRRFNQKVKFDYLSREGKEALFERMLLPLTSCSPSLELLERVLNIPALTPGDFKVVRQKNFFSKNADLLQLIEQLENEVSYKKNIAKPVKLI